MHCIEYVSFYSLTVIILLDLLDKFIDVNAREEDFIEHLIYQSHSIPKQRSMRVKGKFDC